MQQRNVLSQIRQLAGAAIGALALTLPAIALAESPEQPTLLSMLMPSLADSPANPAEDILARQEIRPAPLPTSTIDLTTQPDNLWERIRNGFAMTNLNDNLVLHYQQWYQNRPDALRRMVERSRPYLHYIVEELEARGMPTEIALLPMVESSFNPMAYSRANASGLWQFIPATGKRFKLEQDWWRDERRDIVASTNAALDYLQTIYDMHGDWHLALASYNWGEGAVKRAVEKNEARGLPTDYPSLNMPNETRNYVPKLQALKNIFGNPALLAQLDIPPIANEAYFATLETARPLDVKTAARLANMSIEEFQRLNPSHNRPVIRPETPVVVPADKLETFRANLENHAAPLSHWQAYTLTATERIDQIAARFDTTAAELARVNGLSDHVRLAAGSTLLVPGVASGPGLVNLFNTAVPLQIVAREPVVPACGKKSKAAACAKPAAHTADKHLASAAHAPLAAPQAKAKGGERQVKVAKSAAPAKPAVSVVSGLKPAAKVARSGNGRRG